MKYEYWFAKMKGIPAKEKEWIRSQVESAKELYCMDEAELTNIGIFEKFRKIILNHGTEATLEEEFQLLQKKNVQFVTMHDKIYPERLRKISSPPYAIYYKGQLPKKDVLTVSIVGARECSAYGKNMAAEFGRELAGKGIQVVSGMARGIDSVSQWSALEAGGESYAVLGCGPDICYPRDQFPLYQRLEMQGGIISEFPPGVEPLKQHFPARNRIISGLSDFVLVMEAKEKSGSLITADMALEQGKDVYALPGPVTSKLSEGCHYLIKQGAGILISPKDFLKDLGFFDEMTNEKTFENKIVLESAENMVYSCLDFHPKNLGYLSAMTKLPLSEIVDSLISLEMRGYIREVSKNYYVKVK